MGAISNQIVKKKGFYHIPAKGEMRVPVELFARKHLIPDERSLDKLVDIASVPAVMDRIVVLPDIHFKIKNFVPSGMAIGLERSVSPVLLGPPNDAMLLAKTNLRVEDLDGKKLDEFFDGLKRRIVMFRRTEPIIDEEALWPLLQSGVSSVFEDWGFSNRDLMAFEYGGNLFSGMKPPSRADLLAAYPAENERPLALPDFVPGHDLVTAGTHGLGVLDGGSHFVELNVVQDLMDSEAAAKLGLEPGQVCIALHTGSADVGLIAHKHYLPDEEEIETHLEGSEAATRFVHAYYAAGNFAFANRLYILARMRELLQEICPGEVSLNVVSDVSHDMLDHVDGRDGLYLHRKGAVRALPASSHPPGHPFEGVGSPFYFPAAVGEFSYVMSNPDGNEAAFNMCSHGAGRRINKDQAVEAYDEESVVRHIEERKVRLYRYGVTEFAGQSPASYKNMDEVMDVLQSCHLAQPIVRLRPLATLKG